MFACGQNPIRGVNWVLNKNCTFKLFFFEYQSSIKILSVILIITTQQSKESKKRKLHKVFYTGLDQKILHPIVNLYQED